MNADQPKMMVIFYVSDQQRSKAFYQAVLGIEPLAANCICPLTIRKLPMINYWNMEVKASVPRKNAVGGMKWHMALTRMGISWLLLS